MIPTVNLFIKKCSKICYELMFNNLIANLKRSKMNVTSKKAEINYFSSFRKLIHKWLDSESDAIE